MLRSLVTILVFLVLSGCMPGPTAKVDPLNTGPRFTDNERINASTFGGSSAIYKTYYGDLAGGLGYSYSSKDYFQIVVVKKRYNSHLDYAGFLNDYFQKSCTRNVMTDKRECQIDIRGILKVYAVGNRPQKVCVQEHDYPGAVAYVRLNGSKPISFGESGCSRSKSIIKRALRADKITAQYGKWPSCTRCTKEETVRGYEEFKKLNDYLENL